MANPPYEYGDLPEARILLQPNVPKPMHGLNPRTILGQSWWDRKRREAYAFFEYKCWACNVQKHNAKYHQWLEGHEAYKIDYEHGRMELLQIMALCHSCHNFIHSGRMLMMLVNGELNWNKFMDIIQHGFRVLKKAGQPANYFALRAYLVATEYQPNHPKAIWHDKAVKLFKNMTDGGAGELDPEHRTPWDQWRLIIDDILYEPVHKSFEEWLLYYQSGGDE